MATIMIGEHSDALTSAGADDAKARSAAAAVAGCENRLNAIERKIDALDAAIGAARSDDLEMRTNRTFLALVAVQSTTLVLLLEMSLR